MPRNKMQPIFFGFSRFMRKCESSTVRFWYDLSDGLLENSEARETNEYLTRFTAL